MVQAAPFPGGEGEGKSIFAGQDAEMPSLPLLLWLLAEGEVLPSSSSFAMDAAVSMSVFTPWSLR